MKIIMGIGLNNIMQYNIKYNTVYFFLLVKFNFIFELLLFYQWKICFYLVTDI